MADSNQKKFVKLLQELFMFDQADLDFGIYRIMNAKRDEINRFLYTDLLPQVKASLAELQSGDQSALEADLVRAIEAAKAAGFDPETSPRVKALREQLKQGFDLVALENEVFSHLFDFFRRYYSEGDFLSLRRYKEGVYAIPYEGEEVKLHWANADQYYIKTSEYFRDYTFKLPSGRRVHFKLIEADTEKDNTKTTPEKDRRFMLADQPPTEEQGELVIPFVYRPDPEKRRQAAINQTTLDTILGVSEMRNTLFAQMDTGLSAWVRELSIPDPPKSDPTSKRTVLEKHLTEYTARNTFDYFIHKDLGKFLRRELDFYIKNEVMHLDDVENETTPRVEQYLCKIKAIRRIAHKIIDLLAQLEDFQKKLWLKKKFVVETNYCVTLDRVPDELYPEIARNDAQREEWVKLFAINQIEGDLHTPKYSVPLNTAFLKANPFLMIDTQFFPPEFKDKLIASLDDLDQQTDGLLTHSENFQALNLLQERYHEQVKCIYIDPPYNTDDDGFPYKDSYMHSSWYSMLYDRIQRSRIFVDCTAAFWLSTDDHEIHRAREMVDSIFQNDFNAIIPVVNNLKGRNDRANIATAHEYLLFYSINGFISHGVPLTEEQRQAFEFIDEEGEPYDLRDLRKRGRPDRREDRPKMWFPIYYNPQVKKCYLNRNSQDEIEITPKKSDGTDGRWRWGKDKVALNLSILHPYFNERGNKWEIDHRVYLKDGDSERTSKPKSFWIDPAFSTDVARRTVVSMMPENERIIGYPKAVKEIENITNMSLDDMDVILDFFAGSGTTAHAVINLNREDGGNRKYILVEMGEYFDTVMKPRIQKVIYSKDWKEGKPVSREGSSHLFKTLRLESYEDTLNNLEVKRTEAQGQLLEQHESFREDYLLRYMLEVEARGSASLLNLDRFADPFNYKLKISTGSVGETKEVNVDLVETFNYLLGLKVKHQDSIRGFKVVTGTVRKGNAQTGVEEKVLVIWRNLKEKSNEDLDEFFQKQGYNSRDMEFASIYVNGDNNLENLKVDTDTWKVRLIEEKFMRLMWEDTEV
ncbi:MAG: site-specific DNA-methyltransferase [bacterium]|nr:site-specific DNA-methyltransferase [bacterium]